MEYNDSKLLSEAIGSIKSGDLKRGKQLLTIVLNHDPNNEAALLWMTQAVSDNQTRITYLRRVVAINPNNDTARRGLQQLETALWEQMPENKFFAAMRTALHDGDRETAKRALSWKLERFPDSAVAWTLLADASDDEQAKQECIARAKELDPKLHIVSDKPAGPANDRDSTSKTIGASRRAGCNLTLFVLIIFALMFIVPVVFCMANTDSSNSTTWTPAPIFHPGDIVSFDRSLRAIPAAYSIETMNEFFDAGLADDDEGIGILMLSGAVVFLPSDMDVRVIDTRYQFLGGRDFCRVRVIDAASPHYPGRFGFSMHIWPHDRMSHFQDPPSPYCSVTRSRVSRSPAISVSPNTVISHGGTQ